MSTTLKTILAIGLVAFVAACAREPEPAPPPPVTPEPIYNKF